LLLLTDLESKKVILNVTLNLGNIMWHP